MSGILAAACCCDQVCPRKRDFRINMRYRAAIRHHYLLSSNVLIDQPIYPPCPTPSLTCQSPAVTDCVFVCDFPDSLCTPDDGEMEVRANFDSGDIEVTIPYISTSLQTEGAATGCGWKVDLGAGLVDSGMTFTGQREVDRNYTVIRFTEDYANAAGCGTATLNPQGASAFVLEIQYGWRCKYFAPPAYFSIRRQPFQPQYNNWTWEIQGSVFRVRDTSGVIQSTINLSGLTLLQAQQQIDALPSVQTVRLLGTIPADSMPATLIEDKAATVLNPSFYESVFLFAPLSREVEWYQHGKFGPYWLAASRLGTNPDTGVICSAQTYRLKWNCDPGDPRDYAGGTNPAAELLFCQSICTEKLDWQNLYDPIAGFDEPNFAAFGGKFASGLGLNNLVWTCVPPLFQPDTKFGAYVAFSSPSLRWCDQYGPSNVPWGWCPGPFGDRAISAGASPQQFWSDASNIDPSAYTLLGPDQDADFCGCVAGSGSPGGFTRCYIEEICRSWRSEKKFCMTRL